MNSKGMLSKIITNRKGSEYKVKPTGPCIPKRIRITRRPGQVQMLTGEAFIAYVQGMNHAQE